MDTGASIVLIVGYPSGPTLRVHAGLSGCRAASNGTLTLFTSPAASERLTALVGSDR